MQLSLFSNTCILQMAEFSESQKCWGEGSVKFRLSSRKKRTHCPYVTPIDVPSWLLSLKKQGRNCSQKIQEHTGGLGDIKFTLAQAPGKSNRLAWHECHTGTNLVGPSWPGVCVVSEKHNA